GDLVVGVTEIQSTQRLVSTRTHNYATLIVGATPQMQQVRRWDTTHGRFFTDAEGKKQAAVGLLGQTVRQKLFPDTPDPVGQWVRIDRLRVQVIGVLAPKGRAPTGGDQDDQVFLPLSTVQRKVVGDERINIILTAVKDQDQIDRVKKLIEDAVRREHRVRPGNEDFDVSSVQEMAELAVVLTATMQVLTII